MSSEDLESDLASEEVGIKVRPDVADRYKVAAHLFRGHILGDALDLKALDSIQLEGLTYLIPTDFEPELTEDQERALNDLRCRARALLRGINVEGPASKPSELPSAHHTSRFLGFDVGTAAIGFKNL